MNIYNGNSINGSECHVIFQESLLHNYHIGLMFVSTKEVKWLEVAWAYISDSYCAEALSKR